MEERSKAIQEIFDWKLSEDSCTRLYNDAYEYILYNDTQSFLEYLDYSMSLKEMNVTLVEEYLQFKFLLMLMLEKHPKKLLMLLPVSGNNELKIRINNKILVQKQGQSNNLV